MQAPSASDVPIMFPTMAAKLRERDDDYVEVQTPCCR